jgi:hypothetical protein
VEQPTGTLPSDSVPGENYQGRGLRWDGKARLGYNVSAVEGQAGAHVTGARNMRI